MATLDDVRAALTRMHSHMANEAKVDARNKLHNAMNGLDPDAISLKTMEARLAIMVKGLADPANNYSIETIGSTLKVSLRKFEPHIDQLINTSMPKGYDLGQYVDGANAARELRYAIQNVKTAIASCPAGAKADDKLKSAWLRASKDDPVEYNGRFL